ncbi:MerR family transcriptional regulator [Listeria innocua]|uniref:MerR family transcriptional regulator n=1 Tax=Listeria innocua TaxID=1642 RepID=UPI001624E6E9|nr:MerR family transcriptional regulator [Listeria innocua]MBC1377870.1 MerR family transcriptional regulator [Listeria innocua]
MNDIDLARAKKCSRLELRKQQNEIINKLESNYKTLEYSEKKELYNDLQILESIGNYRKGFYSGSQLNLLTKAEYIEMSKTMNDKAIAKELDVSVASIGRWKKSKNIDWKEVASR